MRPQPNLTEGVKTIENEEILERHKTRLDWLSSSLALVYQADRKQ